MAEVGELIVGAYLSAIKKCDLVQYNTKLQETHSKGEIDVVGINIKTNEAYFCEVATHMITGLQYVKDKRPDNVRKLLEKFDRDIGFANQYFKEFKKTFMLWSPIVKKTQQKAKVWDQEKDVADIVAAIRQKYDIELSLIVNETYWACLTELKKYAAEVTHVPDSPIIRLYQIESRLSKHVRRLTKQKNV